MRHEYWNSGENRRFGTLSLVTDIECSKRMIRKWRSSSMLLLEGMGGAECLILPLNLVKPGEKNPGKFGGVPGLHFPVQAFRTGDFYWFYLHLSVQDIQGQLWDGVRPPLRIFSSTQKIRFEIRIRASLPHSISATVIFFLIHFGTK